MLWCWPWISRRVVAQGTLRKLSLAVTIVPSKLNSMIGLGLADGVAS